MSGFVCQKRKSLPSMSQQMPWRFPGYRMPKIYSKSLISPRQLSRKWDMLENSAFLSSKTHWNLYCINAAEKSLDEDTKKFYQSDSRQEHLIFLLTDCFFENTALIIMPATHVLRLPIYFWNKFSKLQNLNTGAHTLPKPKSRSKRCIQGPSPAAACGAGEPAVPSQ